MDNLPVIAIRFALYADLMVLTGVTAFSHYALTREERGVRLNREKTGLYRAASSSKISESPPL